MSQQLLITCTKCLKDRILFGSSNLDDGFKGLPVHPEVGDVVGFSTSQDVGVPRLVPGVRVSPANISFSSSTIHIFNHSLVFHFHPFLVVFVPYLMVDVRVLPYGKHLKHENAKGPNITPEQKEFFLAHSW